MEKELRYEELKELEIEELRDIFRKNLNAEVPNTLAYLGSLGVSPKHMNMYIDSMERINEYKETGTVRTPDKETVSDSPISRLADSFCKIEEYKRKNNLY